MADETTEVTNDDTGSSEATEATESTATETGDKGGGEEAKPTGAAATIAGGAKTEATAEAPADWPEDWRSRLAGDDKTALKTLDRFGSPSELFGSYRDLREWRDKGGVLKVPGKDASEDEVKAFHKALGAPDKADDYVANLNLGEGVTLGDADKEIMGGFAEDMLAAGATQAQMDAAGRWYKKMEAKAADEMDAADATFKQEQDALLSKEWGGEKEQHVYEVGLAFKDAPGGMEAEGEGLMARLMSGRMADGSIIGNDAEVLRWLSNLGRTLHPAATVTGSADADATGVDERLKEIKGWMAKDDDRYWKDEKVQDEYRRLLDASKAMKAA